VFWLKPPFLNSTFIFSVDRDDIFIIGCCMYRGTGTVDYDLDLYDSSNEKNPKKLASISKGVFTLNDCVENIAQLKFERAIPIKANVKYGLKWTTRSTIVFYGESGKPSVLGSDGTTFNFSNYPNGHTTGTWGQIPQMLYCKTEKLQPTPYTFNAEQCGTNVLSTPVKLETTDGRIFFLVGRKQCDTIRFWIYIIGSSMEAKHYSYNLSITNNCGDGEQIDKGKLYLEN
jgi:hypothetical protein